MVFDQQHHYARASTALRTKNEWYFLGSEEREDLDAVLRCLLSIGHRITKELSQDHGLMRYWKQLKSQQQQHYIHLCPFFEAERGGGKQRSLSIK